MIVKRIVTNFAATDVSKARHFYADILGLEVVMDHGWIVTFASPAQMAPQVSVATEGGSGTPVPDISIEVHYSRNRCGFCNTGPNARRCSLGRGRSVLFRSRRAYLVNPKYFQAEIQVSDIQTAAQSVGQDINVLNAGMSVMNCRRFLMCGWPPPGKRKLSVPHRRRLQSCVRPVHAVRMDCWP